MKKPQRIAATERIRRILQRNGQLVIPDGSGWMLMTGHGSAKHETRIAAIIAGCNAMAAAGTQAITRQGSLFS